MIPAQACSFDATITIIPIRNPQGGAIQSLRSYEFGPSGLTFAQPVTITIPYSVQDIGGVRACWFDCGTGTFSEQGITEVQSIQVGPGLRALRFKTTHFTPYYVVSADSPAGSGGSGGGCSLAVGQEGDAAEYFVPYLILAMVMVVLHRRDKRRRSASPGRSRRATSGWIVGYRITFLRIRLPIRMQTGRIWKKKMLARSRACPRQTAFTHIFACRTKPIVMSNRNVGIVYFAPRFSIRDPRWRIV